MQGSTKKFRRKTSFRYSSKRVLERSRMAKNKSASERFEKSGITRVLEFQSSEVESSAKNRLRTSTKQYERRSKPDEQGEPKKNAKKTPKVSAKVIGLLILSMLTKSES